MTAQPQLQSVDATYVTRKVFPAGDWALEEKQVSRAVVGRDNEILWARGESLIIVGDTGHGKSTVAQNIVCAGIGLQPEALGMLVQPMARVLYIAADRPSQIKYSIKRMVSEATREHWNSRVFIHEGPLDFTLNDHPELLLPFLDVVSTQHFGGLPLTHLVIDSLKDLVSAMDENEQGIQINHAFQAVCQSGIELAACLHPRKMGSPGKKDEREPVLDDVGGNKLITAGAGSVLYIGSPANGLSKVYHLKSPAGKIEDMMLRFNSHTGRVAVNAIN